MPSQQAGGGWEVLHSRSCFHCPPSWFWFCSWWWKPWALPLGDAGQSSLGTTMMRVVSQAFCPFDKHRLRNWAHVAGHEPASDKLRFYSTGYPRAHTTVEASFSLSLPCLKEHQTLTTGFSTCLFCQFFLTSKFGNTASKSLSKLKYLLPVFASISSLPPSLIKG